MKEVVLCISAFSISMLIAGSHLFAKPNATVQKKNYLLIECDSLHENNYSVNVEDQNFKAISECFFGGYYPNEPVTEL
jgi:hypothetical protein